MTNVEDFEVPEDAYNFLKEPMSIADLIKDGCTFEINSKFDESIALAADEELNLGSLELGSEEEEDPAHKSKVADYQDLISPWTKPFSELKLQMTKLNNYLWKRITKEGNCKVPAVPQNARVCARYNAFWEGDSAPFDSSILRGRTFKFRTGVGEVLEGLETAVCTMHPGENAQFIISYHLLFHELGCPPRIKPKADGLFIIELLSYDVVGNLNAELEVPEEDRNKYALIKNKIHEMHLSGLDSFKQSRLHAAVKAFEKTLNLLKFCILANESEAAEQSKFIIRVATNLAVCYNKMHLPNRTCVMCKEIRHLTDKPSCKALFQEGRALLMLGDYKKARECLIRAQHLEPHNNDINRELKLLSERYEKYQKDQSALWKKAFGVIRETTSVSSSSSSFPVTSSNGKLLSGADLSHLEQQILKIMENFRCDPNRHKLNLPPGLTSEEINTVKSMAQSLNLKFYKDPMNGSAFTLIKSQDSN